MNENTQAETIEPADTIIDTPASPSPVEAFRDVEITIAKGIKVMLSEIRASADPKCRYCSRGVQVHLTAQGRMGMACGCGVRNVLRRMRGENPSAPAVTVETNPAIEAERAARERDRLAKKRERVLAEIAALRAQAEEIDGQIAERVKGHDAGIAEAEAEVRRVADELAVQDIRTTAAEVECSAAREALEAAERCLAGERRAHGALSDQAGDGLVHLAELQAHVQAVLDSTAGARHRAENLRRQADLLAARHVNLLREPGE